MRPGRAADHSPPSSAAVKEQYSYTSTHPLDHTGPVTGSLYLYLYYTQTEKVLRYKLDDRWFDSRWCHRNFLLTKSSRSHSGPGIDSASNRNEYQKHFLGVKAAGA